MPVAEPAERAIIRDRIVASVDATLRAQQSVLMDDDVTAGEVRGQVRDIVNDTLLALADEADLGVFDPSAIVQRVQAGIASANIGRSRAGHDVHPSDSLSAASALFDLALPRLIEALGDVTFTAPTAIAVARALHHCIMARVASASVGYVDVLLERLSVAQTEERMRVSRELHDRVAHGIAASLQRVNLGITAARTSTDDGIQMFTMATGLLEQALDDTREIALELRQTVGNNVLDDAVRDFLGDAASAGSTTAVHTEGIPRQIPAGVGEEVFLIIREALRNAVAHAKAAHIDVTFTWTAHNVAIEIHDDGIGFDPFQVRTESMGLLTMRERADVIGADMTITSKTGEGTSITLTVPSRNGTR
ncbi:MULTISPECIES: sensor histidine kinase [unclassified Cryobacterium]|uniref:sensor histidine kinase n=1 Tax=unclassified Cryobacterium TaxID=2649013 RepID=UPI00106C3758|nr:MULTISPECIES: ATP-binding protein [unclassified Cryobacterium]TFB97677.1 sensor histidine kinase [Cryobacterium sp. MDB2-A-1]TFC07797.1 sensor histidine kinase [Cryobacterium sp. MDB2-A-2]TFC21029.1 sensor histidine kinase [Cryobacterium sp. MDB2-10]